MISLQKSCGFRYHTTQISCPTVAFLVPNCKTEETKMGARKNIPPSDPGSPLTVDKTFASCCFCIFILIIICEVSIGKRSFLATSDDSVIVGLRHPPRSSAITEIEILVIARAALWRMAQAG